MRFAVRGLHQGPVTDRSTLQCARPGQNESSLVVWFECSPFGLADLVVVVTPGFTEAIHVTVRHLWRR
jgi:hypothetical protein